MDYLQLYILGKRLTEQRELTALRGLSSLRMVIADIGANVGFYTMEMARSVASTGRILAFEPDAFSFGLLQSRMKRAGTVNIEAYPLTFGDKTGRAFLYCSAYNRADNRLSKSHREPNVEATEVQVCTVDEFMSSRAVSALDGLKIDVQGAEEQVLRGAQATTWTRAPTDLDRVLPRTPSRRGDGSGKAPDPAQGSGHAHL